MRTYAYAATRTRTEAVVDQFDIFLQYAGLPEASREKVLGMVERRWIEKVGVYLLEAGGKRVLEVAVNIDWPSHDDLVAISPIIGTDLPGWESGAAPEIRTLGRRFGTKAREYGQTPRHWVQFTTEIRSDAELHRRRCADGGYQYRSGLPDWRNPPVRRDDMRLLDLEEICISIAEA
ncbi:hypothetical protein SD37_39995 [Amycolatopsis orientalis]|uniref:Uncharacterized protein n=1 Tax=Amycolatopsis orientalis TaxID=31958 RepID=A0A193C976_AMYOR|nr:hypothetical protein [Amycolatopsis orientalis]ANN21166.1 hypothetical protein SD37_39995 [Amycolatopsis orientalis]